MNIQKPQVSSLAYKTIICLILITSVVSCGETVNKTPNDLSVDDIICIPSQKMITKEERDSMMRQIEIDLATDKSVLNYSTRSLLYMMNEQWEQSNQDADSALFLLPEADTTDSYVILHFRKAHNYSALGLYDEAEAELKLVVDQYKDDPEAQEALAEFYCNRGEYDKALVTLPDSLSIMGVLTRAEALAMTGGQTEHQRKVYSESWNTPTMGLSRNEKALLSFGRIGPWDRSFREDTLSFPPVPGHIHKSNYTLCRKDTCYANYSVFAVRCPENETLRSWIAGRLYEFVKDCVPFDVEKRISPIEYMPKEKRASMEAICDFYSNEYCTSTCFWRCHKDGEHGRVNKQDGLLLVDCWQSRGFCTFYESRYSNDLAGGNAGQEAFRTIDTVNGKELKLNDFIDESDFGELANLILPRLKNGNGQLLQELYPDEFKNSESVLVNAIDGCAIIREGFVVYYPPYSLASGADGVCMAVIPYRDMKDILKIW